LPLAIAQLWASVCSIACGGRTIYVSRELYIQGSLINTNPKSDGELVDLLMKFMAGLDALSGEQRTRNPNGNIVIVRDDPDTESFRTELMRRGVYQLAADTELLAGIQLVGSLFQKKQVRVSSKCRHFIAEHTNYSWDASKLRAGIEEPQATNKQAVEAFRHYVKTRVNPWRIC